MKKLIIGILTFMLFADPVYCIVINEIMYNPEGNDNNAEYVELYFNNIFDTTQNMSGWTIADSSSNDTLTIMHYSPSPYALIVEEGFNHSGLNATIYSIGTTIGDNLDNDADELFLYNSNGTLIAYANYTNNYANGNSKSLEFYNGTFYESIVNGTPGERNSVVEFFNQTINKTINQTLNLTNSSNNIAINNTNITNNSSSHCFSTINITTDKDIFNDGEKISYKFKLSNASLPYTIEYWIDDLHGNNIKKSYTTTNTNTKSYTPRIDEFDRVLVIKAKLSLGCSNQSTLAEKNVVIINKNPEKSSSKSESSSSKSTSSSKKENKKQLKKIDYTLLDFTKEKQNNNVFKTKLLIDNEDSPHKFTVWSYVYRGSKSYSGERESNKITVDIKSGESEIVELLNAVNASPGEYKFKIKIQKDSQKSTTDITKDIVVMSNKAIDNLTNANKSKTKVDQNLMSVINHTKKLNNSVKLIDNNESDQGNATTIFSSRQNMIKKGIGYSILALFSLLLIIFIFRY